MEANRRKFGLTARILLILFAGIAVMLLLERFNQERTIANQNACIQNLRIIDGAREQAGMDLGMKRGGKLTPEQITSYIPGGFLSLKCRAEGTYSINPLGVSVTCSVPGHALP